MTARLPELDGLSALFRLPVIRLEEMRSCQPAFDLVPYADAQRRKLVLLRAADEALLAVLGNPYDSTAQDWLEENVRMPFAYRLAQQADIELWLAQQEQSLNAMQAIDVAGSEGVAQRGEVEDVSMAHVRFASGALGSIVNSVLSPRQVSYVRFDFQRATVELEHLYSHRNDHWRFSIPENATHEDDLARWRTIADDVQASHAAQLSHTLNALEAGEPPLTCGAQARNTVEFLTALYKSAFTRQRVERGSIDQDDPFYYHVYGAAKPVHDRG